MTSSPDNPAGEQPPPPPRRLTRSAADRQIAGVAGGIARHFDLDPSLVRIAFVVLAIFGGIGLALYAVCALVVPTDDGAPPVSTLTRIALGAIIFAALVSILFVGPGSVVLLVLAAVVVLVWRAVGGNVDPRLTKVALVVVGTSAALVLGIGAGVAAAFGAGTAMAILVILAGVGLVVGGLRGGARWLIAPALLLALPVSLVSAADIELEGGVGEREYRPVSVSDLRPSYSLGAGRLRVDLRDLKLERGTTTDLRLRVGAGAIELLVPQTMCVQATAHVGAGETDLLSVLNDGVDVDAEYRFEPNGDSPVLRVDARAGLGRVAMGLAPRDFRDTTEGFQGLAACLPDPG